MKNNKFYKILNVEPNASLKEIKTSYKKLAFQYHPDRPDGDADKFKELSKAYEVLSDSQKRQLYDRFGEYGLNPGHHPSHRNMQKINVPDIQHQFKVSLKDLYTGKKLGIRYSRQDLCGECDGSGSKSGKLYNCYVCGGSGVKVVIRQLGPVIIQQMQAVCDSCNGKGNKIDDDDKCSECNGNKVKQGFNSLDLEITKGLPSGINMAVKGEGHYDPVSNRRSDFVLTLECDEHPIFERIDNNLKMNVEVKLIDSLYGSTYSFEHLSGKMMHFDYHMIRNKDVKIIKGQGMPIHQSDKYGDLIIEFSVKYPSEEFLMEHKKALFGDGVKGEFEDSLKVELNDVVQRGIDRCHIGQQ